MCQRFSHFSAFVSAKLATIGIMVKITSASYVGKLKAKRGLVYFTAEGRDASDLPRTSVFPHSYLVRALWLLAIEKKYLLV